LLATPVESLAAIKSPAEAGTLNAVFETMRTFPGERIDELREITRAQVFELGSSSPNSSQLLHIKLFQHRIERLFLHRIEKIVMYKFKSCLSAEAAFCQRFFREPINPTAGAVQARNPFEQITAAAGSRKGFIS
jgi:hypothetical protein